MEDIDVKRFFKLTLPKNRVNGIIRQNRMKMRKPQFKKRRDYTNGSMLIELMIAVGIMVVVLVGYLHLFVYCLGLAETSGNITLTITEAQDKLEEMRNHNFNTLTVDYGASGVPGDEFSLSQLNGKGKIYFVPTGNPDLLHVEIVVAWVDKNNRTIGGVDDDSDGRIDSPIELETMIANR